MTGLGCTGLAILTILEQLSKTLDEFIHLKIYYSLPNLYYEKASGKENGNKNRNRKPTNP